MNNNSVSVSIVVPIFNTEDYLPACIDSLCNQSYRNIQIVLVDDKSPDKCPEICDYYAEKDDRIIVVHQENKGVSGARNTGIRYATGDYIMFVDSDDELYYNAVELLLNDSIEYNADIVSATKRVVDKAGKTISIYDSGECNIYDGDEPLLLSLEGERNSNSACAKLFKASFIQDVWFEEGKNINEDGFFVFQCYLRKPLLVQHDIPIYQYNVREGSTSRQCFSNKHLAMLYFCDKKKSIISKCCHQHIEDAYNMVVRTNLNMLDLLCSSSEKKYKSVERSSISIVQELYRYHKPINTHHKKLAWIVKHGLYPIYKLAIRMKYYR